MGGLQIRLPFIFFMKIDLSKKHELFMLTDELHTEFSVLDYISDIICIANIC
jgi:hypothetical protein